MKLSRRRRETVAAMSMTPLIDIVFLLLIFFMTVTQISAVNRERLALPNVRGGEDQAAATMTINIDRRGRMTVTGRPYSLVDLVGMVSDEIAALGDDPTRLAIVLRADRRGASRAVNDVVSALGRLGVVRVRVAIERDAT